ncbi:uncharacterized protein [Primulina eburnea]|uniref:uncharacterized protein n=1 Tax=Primulina eburnea TaxID=1245227 RepID=UPI003C6C2F29
MRELSYEGYAKDKFVNDLGFEPTRTDVNYSVAIPSKEELSASSVVRDMDFELQGHKIYADLIVRPMPEFDIIVEMDRLSKNEARKLMHKGCQAFLASIISAPASTSRSILDVPFVREFPDGVAGIVPTWEVEFSIERMPRTVPITMAPYRLVSAEMNELKHQIKKLLDKGFMRKIHSGTLFYCSATYLIDEEE